VGPIFLIAGLLHYSGLAIPDGVKESSWVQESTARWEKYAKRKGWVADDDEALSKAEASAGESLGIVMDLAVGWAITKALLPFRLAFSVWATPWFAGVAVLPIAGLVARLGGRRTAGQLAGDVQSPAAGTNAIGGGVIGKTAQYRRP